MTVDQAAAATAPPADTGLGHPVAQSADPIDSVVRLAPKWTLAALLACALLIASALVWAFAGEITQTVSRPGVMHDSGYQVVTFTSAGTIKEAHVKQGDSIAKGAVIFDFTDGSQLLSPRDGHVSSVYKSHGAKVEPEDTAISITDYTTPNKVFTMLPSSMMGTVVAGMPVEVEFSNAPAAQYGYAKGWIEMLSAEPLTAASLIDRIGLAQDIVEGAVGREAGLATLVALETNLKNPSTLTWTVGTGPNFVPSNGTSVTVNVILSAKRPIQILFPLEDSANAVHKARA